MIKMNCEHFEESLLLKENECNILVVESRSIYSKILFSLYTAGDSYFQLFNESYQDLKKDEFFIVWSPLNFDLEQQVLKTLLYKKIERDLAIETTIKQEMEESYQHLLRQMMHFVFENEAFSLSFQEEMNVKEVLKLFGISIAQEKATTVFEKVLLILSSLKELMGKRLFIFAHLSSWLSEKEMLAVMEIIHLNQLTVLLIEQDAINLESTRHWCLDKDFYIVEKNF